MRRWTVEERKKQSELIRKWKPWEKSSGPKGREGKERSKKNAYKHGARSEEVLVSQAILRELFKEVEW